MASVVVRQAGVFEFPREEALHIMVPHTILRGGVEFELLSRFFYNIRSSTMNTNEVAKTWISTLEQMHSNHAELDSKFINMADRLFDRVLRAIILNTYGTRKEDVEDILRAKKKLEAAACA